jgi:hypothetical protein
MITAQFTDGNSGCARRRRISLAVVTPMMFCVLPRT